MLSSLPNARAGEKVIHVMCLFSGDPRMKETTLHSSWDVEFMSLHDDIQPMAG
jgi:hypothetical protein